MKKNLLAILFVIGVFVTPVFAFEKKQSIDGYYYGSIKYVNRFVRNSTNVLNTNIGSVDSAYSYHNHVLAFSFGKKVENNGLRFDLEYVKGPVKQVSEKIEEVIDTMSFNLYYDFLNKSIFTPYVSLGSGIMFLRGRLLSNLIPPDSRIMHYNLYHSIGFGSSMYINEYFGIDFGYRYVNYGKDISSNYENLGTEKRLAGNDLFIGVRFRF